MNAVPFEVLEQIIAHLPTDDLFSLCHTDRTLFKLVRHEAYKRWKQWAIKYGELFWADQELDKICSELERNNGHLSYEWTTAYKKLCANLTNLKRSADEQMYIMEKMRRHGMIVDDHEKGIVDYCLIVKRWTSDPWELNWSWCYAEWLADNS